MERSKLREIIKEEVDWAISRIEERIKQEEDDEAFEARQKHLFSPEDLTDKTK